MAGIAGVVFGLVTVFIATRLFVGPSGDSFNWIQNCLSDIGVSNVDYLFNYTLIITGLFGVFFMLGFLKVHSRGLLFAPGGIVLILSLASLSLVGAFPESNPVIHDEVSSAYFSLFPIGTFLTGIAFLRNKVRREGLVSMLVTLAYLLEYVIFFALLGGYSHGGLEGCAVGEFTASLFFGLWITLMSPQLLRYRSVPNPTGPEP